MAEIYPLGKNRIFYRPQGFVEGLIVTVDMIDPRLKLNNQNDNDDMIMLIEFGEGLYYFDYSFSLEGTYIGIFYENGKKRTSQAFSTRRIPAATKPFIFRGDQVIG